MFGQKTDDFIQGQAVRPGNRFEAEAVEFVVNHLSSGAGMNVIVSDGSGGAIATWEDQRIGGGNSDIYAQRIYSNGNLYTSVKDLSRIVPNEFKLGQNYPNPFNPSTTIEIGLPVKSRVTLRVYNMLGQEVALLINGRELPAGLQQVSWMAGAASGVYIYRMEAVSLNDPGKGFVEAKKMLLVK